MAFHLHTEIEIDAQADRVWAILSDLAAYPSWNPFVIRAEGTLALDARLAVSLRPPSGRAMQFKPHVSRLEPGRCFAWRGSLPIPGLFTGEHQFEVVPLGTGKVRLVHSERFSGLLVPLLKKSLDGDTRRGFEAMNAAVKTRAEG
jgi:hypothetical protein